MLKLYLDENIPEAVGLALSLRGYDVLTTVEAGNKGKDDLFQLEFASSQGRLLFTFNVKDFVMLHLEFLKKGKPHKGIIVSKQISTKESIDRLIRLILTSTEEKVSNNLVWLSDYLS